MKNSKFFSVLFLMSQSGYLVAAGNNTQFAPDYDYDSLLDAKWAAEAREQEKAALKIKSACQKAREQEQKSQELAVKKAQALTTQKANEEAAQKEKLTVVVVSQHAPSSEPLLTQAVEALKKLTNQVVEKTLDTALLVEYKVHRYVHNKKAAKPKAAHQESASDRAEFEKTLDNSSTAFIM